MITEDYISFETAKLLKEKEFNEKVLSYYDTEGQGYFISPRECNIGTGSVYAAPTLQMTMKWLREKYNIDMLITIGGFTEKGKVYFCSVYKNLINYGDLKECSTYEEACEAAIKYCLENLI